MKTLRQTCATVILTLALAVSVLAGEIDCPGVVAPAPSPSETTSTTSDGDITTTIILMIVTVIS